MAYLGSHSFLFPSLECFQSLSETKIHFNSITYHNNNDLEKSEISKLPLWILAGKLKAPSAPLPRLPASYKRQTSVVFDIDTRKRQ